MNKHQKGQGLVEYALILVLVAITVVVIGSLLGPAIAEPFCGLYDGLYSQVKTVYMDINDEEVFIDYSPFGGSCHYASVVLVEEPSHGTLINFHDGTFTYQQNEIGSGIDDSFSFQVSFDDSLNSTYYRVVQIIVGETDQILSETNLLNQLSASDEYLEEANEKIILLWEQAENQEMSLAEGAESAGKAAEKGLKVLREYAEEINNLAFYDAITQLLEEVKAGNFNGIPDVISTNFETDLAEAPLEVQAKVTWKAAPHIIESCQEFSNGAVSEDVITEAVQAIDNLPDDYPNKTELQQNLLQIISLIEARNTAIETTTAIQSDILDLSVGVLESAGEMEWAEKVATDSQVCGE